MIARLILAIISLIIEEAALVVIWLWGLPEFGIQLHVSILIIVMVGLAVYSAIAYQIASNVLRRPELLGLPSMVGGRAKVTRRLNPEGMVTIESEEGMVTIESELWQARSVEGNVEIGEEVLVVGQKGLRLFVRKTKKSG